MENKYYDTWKFRQAIAYIENDPVKAKKELEEYIQNYPVDYCAYTYYASSMITIGELDEAEEVLDKAIRMALADAQFNERKDRVNHLYENALRGKLRILSYQGRYEEMYNICEKHKHMLNHMNMEDVIFYCKAKLGKFDISQRDKEVNTYIYRQIIEYQESDFIDHMKRHFADHNADLDDRNEVIFSADFPFNEIVEEIKKYIPSNKRWMHGFYDNVYSFKYDNCGRAHDKIVDYFRVVCLHDTKEFITMYPCAESKNLSYIDLNYMKKENDKKVTISSARERFNKRYNRS